VAAIGKFAIFEKYQKILLQRLYFYYNSKARQQGLMSYGGSLYV